MQQQPGSSFTEITEIHSRTTPAADKRPEGKCEISPLTLSYMYQKVLHERKVGKKVTMRPGRAHTCRNQTCQQLLKVIATQHVMKQTGAHFLWPYFRFPARRKRLAQEHYQPGHIPPHQSKLLKFLGNFNCRL